MPELQGCHGLVPAGSSPLCSLCWVSFGALYGFLTEILLLLSLQCSLSQTAKVSGHLLGEGPLGSHRACERLELGASEDIFAPTFLTHLRKSSLNTSWSSCIVFLKICRCVWMSALRTSVPLSWAWQMCWRPGSLRFLFVNIPSQPKEPWEGRFQGIGVSNEPNWDVLNVNKCPLGYRLVTEKP